MPSPRALTLSGLALAVSLAGSLTRCGHTLRVPAPSVSGPGAPLPELPSANITLPLTADLQSTLAQLERQVPATMDTDGQFRIIPGTPVGVRYRVQRAPFRFESRDGALQAETSLSISAEACVGGTLGVQLPIVGQGVCVPVASCGVGEAPRRVVVRTVTNVRLDPAWRIVSETAPAPPRFIDRCELTAFRVDVTDFVAQLVAAQVATATRDMDASIASRGDLRPRAQTLWASLHDPIELGEGFWLSLNPEAVHAGAVTLDPSSVRTVVGIEARPHVVAGARPTPSPSELPALDTVTEAPSGQGLRLTFDAEVPFSEVQSLVAGEFRGRTMELEGHQVLVRDVRVRGSGSALLFAVDVQFRSGPFSDEEGTVYMAGLPDYDQASGALVVRELDYTLESRNALLGVAEWLMRGSLRSSLAQRARFPVAPRIERLRARAQEALTRTLAPGTTLRGRLEGVRPVGAFVTPTGVIVRVVADGSAEVTQDLGSLGLTGDAR